MPPDRYSFQDAFDISILDPRVLDTSDGLATALHAIETVCHRGDPEIAEMIAALNSRPYILEYIISGTLRIPIGPYASPALIILHSSVGGRGVWETLEVDTCRASHAHNTEYDGHREHAGSREIIIFVAFCGVSIRRRRTPQPPRISKQPPCIPTKGGTFVCCSQYYSGGR